RIRRVRDSFGRDRHLGLDRRLLATLGRGGLLVGARALDVVLRCAAPAAASLAPPRALSPATLAHRPEPFAVGAASPAPLAGGAEALGRAAAAAGLVLVAEARVALRGPLEALRHDLALVDPDLDADPAEGRLRLGEPVVDVGADRVQRHATLRVHLRAAHLAAAEPPAADHLDAVSAGAHRRGQRALHLAPDADPVLELLGDRLGDKLGVELGPLDLVDVDVHGLVGHAVDLLAE